MYITKKVVKVDNLFLLVVSFAVVGLQYEVTPASVVLESVCLVEIVILGVFVEISPHKTAVYFCYIYAGVGCLPSSPIPQEKYPVTVVFPFPVVIINLVVAAVYVNFFASGTVGFKKEAAVIFVVAVNRKSALPAIAP